MSIVDADGANGNPAWHNNGTLCAVDRSSIDLNADLGEGEPHDELLLGIVSSCNVACGGHAGETQSMTETVRLASRHGVAVGAHPSYPDRDGFGRRSHFLAGDALLASLTTQLDALAEVCRRKGTRLETLKPHGALYNDAARDEALAGMLAQLAARFALELIGLPGAATETAARYHDVPYRREGFVDRSYRADGSLSPRGLDGALIESPSAAARQALQLARGMPIATIDGEPLCLDVDTLCLHGDTPGAADIAKAVSTGLADAEIKVASPAHG